MTWFRCGGGSGIPAALKNRMNAVFNKKFGTAVDYPAEGWPDDVNLMGPLPEKTIVSSPIADFSDGADDVPTKTVKISIPPTLSGVSAVTETQTGQSVFLPMDIEQGSINSTGSNINSTTRIRTAERKAVTPSTEYKIKVNSEVQIYEVHEYTDLTGSSTHLTVNASEYTFTTQSTTNYLRILFRYSNNATITPSAITEIEVTDDWKTYTASLGRTIYGGEVDIVNGQGKDTTLRYELDENDSWSAYSGASHSFWHNVATGEDRPIKQTEASESICNYATYSSASPSSAPDFSFLIQGGQRIVVTADSTIDTVDKFKTWLSSHNLVFVCPSTTPTDFTFTGQEVPTRLGYNAFWSDQGDTEVTYRADISLALQAASGSRGLMMASRPAIGPANGDQGSEEKTKNNIETEGEEDAR